MQSSNKAAVEMRQHCKTVFEEYYFGNKKNGTTHTIHNNQHYTTGIPVAGIPDRKKYVSKSKSETKRKAGNKMKQKARQHLKQQERKKNETELEDDTTATTVSCSTSTMNTYADSESVTAISCSSFTAVENTPTSVRFDLNANEQYGIESHTDFSDKERSKYWWSDREKDRTMNKLERLIHKCEKRASKNKNTTTTKPSSMKMILPSQSSTCSLNYFRGFESWTTDGSLKLDYAIEQCRNAVFDEQNTHWNNEHTKIGYNYDDDSIKIANCCLRVTKDSALRAQLNGIEDAKEAWRVLGESWIINDSNNDDDVNSVGSVGSYGKISSARKKKQNRKRLARIDSFTSTKKITKKDKEKAITNIINDEEGAVVVSTTTSTKLEKKKNSRSSKSKSKISTSVKSLSDDPPGRRGSRLLIQEEEEWKNENERNAVWNF